MKKITYISTLVMVVLLAAACTRTSEDYTPSDPQQFTGYISSYTSGVISAHAPVVIKLGKAVTTYEPGTRLPEKTLRFEPPLSGHAYLTDAFTIEYRPVGLLKHGQHYTGLFKLDRVLDTIGVPADFVFNFMVIAQDFTVFPGRLMESGSNKEKLKDYEGVMITADDMRLEDAQKIITLSSPADDLKLEVISENPRHFNYAIRNIVRRDKAYSIQLQWNGEEIDLAKQGSLDIHIPSVNEFTLLNVAVNQADNDQFIRLTFSDPIDPLQNLTGLVQIKQHDKNLRIQRQGSDLLVYPQQRINGEASLVLDAALRNASGNALDSRQELVVALSALKPQVEIAGKGNIMPDSRNLMLSFRSVSLRAVDVTVYKIYSDNVMQFFQHDGYNTAYNLREVSRPVYRKMVRLDKNPEIDLQQWNAFSIDLTNMINRDPGAVYNIKISFRKEYVMFNCGADDENALKKFENLPLYADDEAAWWDGGDSYYYEFPENYKWSQRDDPCTDSYYVPERFPRRNLLSGNLGIIAKSSDNKKFTVAVTNLLTTAPQGAAMVDFYNYQQQHIGNIATNSDGMSRITLEQVPYLIRASKEGQQAWLKVDDGSSLSMSTFDVSGQKISGGIKGMMYGERGVWRPGDTLFLAFVMDDISANLPYNHPVVMELYNPRGQLSAREVKTEGVNGFYVFKPVTNAQDPTGSWRARIIVGGATFEKSIRIETIKPNRLKMDLSFGRKILSQNQTATLRVAWLHGAAAANLEATVNLRLRDFKYSFDKFEDYSFTDPAKTYGGYEASIFAGTLDANGRASFPLSIQTNTEAPGMLQAIFTTRVTETGGNQSTDVTSMPFAPYPQFVGIKIPYDGRYKNMLTTGTKHQIQIATVDKNGAPVSASGIRLKVFKVSWNWWWSAQNDNLARWAQGEDAELVEDIYFSTHSGTATVPLTIADDDWGRYYLQVVDTRYGHTAGTTVYFDWADNEQRANRGNPAGATLLDVTTDKAVYQPGDMVKVTFASAENSSALLSLENGTDILDYWWVNGVSGQTETEFAVKADMAPNAYLYVTLLQPHAQTINDRPIRMYGVVPIMVEVPASRLNPKVEAPEKVRPDEDYTIKVSEKNGRAMTYTLAVVDEGLLGLTRFSTPDLWQHFYAREALGIKTWDLYDEVLGAYGGRLQRVLAIGGDQSALRYGEQKANRFKPVVTFLGPFELARKKTAVHKLHMPNYVGAVRVMVVAANNGAYGSAEAEIAVKQPVMILPTAPRVIGPGETFDLPVTLFAMNDEIRDVELQLTTKGKLEVVDSKTTTVRFDRAGEKTAYFRLKAPEGDEGFSSLTVQATAGIETTSQTIELQVRNPIEPVTRLKTFALEAGESKTIPYDFFGVEGSNSGTLAVSSFPSIHLDQHLKYLVSYPYGCVEQITSGAFAQLYLDKLTGLTDEQKARVSRNVMAGIRKIAAFQQTNGALSYWPGNSRITEWGTSYAGHFMLLAAQKGYLIPFDFKRKWLNWQTEKASQYNHSLADSDEALMQAYRLYTLALAGEPNMSAMNRLRETELSATARWRLAAAYQLSGQPEVAVSLTENITTETQNKYKWPGRTFGSQLRDEAMILEVLVMMDKQEAAYELASRMAQKMQTDWLSTQSAAFALYALATFAGDDTFGQSFTFDFIKNKKTQNVRSLVPIYTIALEAADAGNSVTVKNTGDGRLFLTRTITGRPKFGTEIAEAKNITMEVSYHTMSGTPLSVERIKQGTDFEAVVTIRNSGLAGNIENMALSQVFPSGWEILSTRYADAGDGNVAASDYDYRDIRDDRVYTFFTLNRNGVRRYSVMLHAAYTGRYYLPPVTCHAMYDAAVYARTAGQWVEVGR